MLSDFSRALMLTTLLKLLGPLMRQSTGGDGTRLSAERLTFDLGLGSTLLPASSPLFAAGAGESLCYFLCFFSLDYFCSCCYFRAMVFFPMSWNSRASSTLR